MEGYDPSPQSEKSLRVLRLGQAHVPSKGGLITMRSATVIGGAVGNSLLSANVIEIFTTAAIRELRLFDRNKQQEVAEKFQPMLLAYRLHNYKSVLDANFDVPYFSAHVRELARSLGACVKESSKLQGHLIKLLETVNALAEPDPDPESLLNAVVIEALLAACHQPAKQFVYVGEIAAANKILHQRGETLQMEPRAVGHRLKSQGLVTKQIHASSRGLMLLGWVRRQIHKLAWELQMFADHKHSPLRDCRLDLPFAKNEVVDVMF